MDKINIPTAPLNRRPIDSEKDLSTLDRALSFLLRLGLGVVCAGVTLLLFTSSNIAGRDKGPTAQSLQDRTALSTGQQRSLDRFHDFERQDKPNSLSKPSAAAANAQTYVGIWAQDLAWCNGHDDDPEHFPITMLEDSMSDYESECKFASMTSRDLGWSVKQVCRSEGKTYARAIYLRVSDSGDRLTLRDDIDGRTKTFQRCSNRVTQERSTSPQLTDAAKKIHNYARLIKTYEQLTKPSVAEVELAQRAEYARLCPDRHLEWLDGPTEWQGFQDYFNALKPPLSARYAKVVDYSKCQAGIDCQIAADALAAFRLGDLPQVAEAFCQRSRLFCTAPDECAAGVTMRKAPRVAAASIQSKTASAGSLTAIAAPPVRGISGTDSQYSCRFPILNNESVQRQANAQIAKMRLREDRIGIRFQIINADIDLDSPDGGNHNFNFVNEAEYARCFPYFGIKMKALHEEYDRRSQFAQSASIVSSTNLPRPVQQTIAENKEHCSAPVKIRPGFIKRRDINGDGILDYILDYGEFECNDNRTYYCGSGGCTMQIFASMNGTFVKALDDRVREVNFKQVNGRSAMILSLHGSECGKIGPDTCIETLFWNGVRFSAAH